MHVLQISLSICSNCNTEVETFLLIRTVNGSLCSQNSKGVGKSFNNYEAASCFHLSS